MPLSSIMSILALLLLSFSLLFRPMLGQQQDNSSSSSSPSASTSNSSSSPSNDPPMSMFLFKSHGVLMTLAWLLFAPVSILFARFQRDPFQRLLGEQLWFQVHRLGNTLTFVCALVGFFCVFSAIGGTWAGPRPGGTGQQWSVSALHALCGAVAVLLALCQPVTALFRCHPDSSCRIVFNVWHGASGYLAWLFAVVAICIAATNFRMVFLSPMAVAILVFVHLVLLLTLFFIMQFLAIRKAQLQLPEWVDQRRLFAAVCALCSAITLAIVLLIALA